MNTYRQYSFKVQPIKPGVDILIAELADLGFEAFEEKTDRLEAFIQENNAPKDLNSSLQLNKQAGFEISFKSEVIAPVNWNTEWEKNFDPIEIANRCRIRAPFHHKRTVDYDIVIEPKMAFGTGHHATTKLMVELMLDEKLSGQSVLDMGCGTGILAILAHMKGAHHINAIDIDEWSVINTKENLKTNNCNTVNVYQGDAKILSNTAYNSIFANINRNILINDIPRYAKRLAKNGALFVSGFYEKDLKAIETAASRVNLTLKTFKTEKDWVAAKFQ